MFYAMFKLAEPNFRSDLFSLMQGTTEDATEPYPAPRRVGITLERMPTPDHPAERPVHAAQTRTLSPATSVSHGRAFLKLSGQD